MKRSILRLFKLLCIVLIGTAIIAIRPWESLPPAWNPWVPLSIDHPMTPVTRMKLSQLSAAPDGCLAVLASVPEEFVDYLALEDYTPVENCQLTNVVRVQSTGVEFNTPFTLTCPLLVRWLMFEQQKLQPLAMRHLGSRVESIDHYGTFSCRNVYNREQGRRSQHASASAFDVATFRFENGAAANVLSDWDNAEVPDSSAFLRDVHSSACAYFGTVLGPDYNAPHANHFHLDTSSFNLCR
ncbi:MAG: extensin family protein [Gammaproteobacteria bacterium]|nr:extensin family protein [Gammaproteobacteria bacterium]MDP2139987.1 extensin family protein [Gammaproteobacteria bacterium]MDP2347807.1 extensin family protein [Gammaproteobacteria bacterium]